MAKTSGKKNGGKSSAKRAVAKNGSDKNNGKQVAKKVQNEVNDKPFYQKWWFWVIVAVFLLFVLAGMSGSNSDNKKISESSNTPSTPKVEETPKIEVADFSTMTVDEIEAWGKTNSVTVSFSRAYSDTVAKDGFVEQTPAAGESVSKNGSVKIVISDGRAPTTGERNALRSAQSYLRHQSFSRSGLIHQLEYEGYSNDEATYAVDNVGADWNEQAVKTAASYLKYMAFSRDGLIHQLEYEGFTREQAEYGVSQNGY